MQRFSRVHRRFYYWELVCACPQLTQTKCLMLLDTPQEFNIRAGSLLNCDKLGLRFSNQLRDISYTTSVHF